MRTAHTYVVWFQNAVQLVAGMQRVSRRKKLEKVTKYTWREISGPSRNKTHIRNFWFSLNGFNLLFRFWLHVINSTLQLSNGYVTLVLYFLHGVTRLQLRITFQQVFSNNFHTDKVIWIYRNFEFTYHSINMSVFVSSCTLTPKVALIHKTSIIPYTRLWLGVGWTDLKKPI